jgi:phospholipase C
VTAPTAKFCSLPAAKGPGASGTGANHILLGTGDIVRFSDGNGNAAVPPKNPVNPANPGTPLPGFTSALSEIENPNPQSGTNNR